MPCRRNSSTLRSTAELTLGRPNGLPDFVGGIDTAEKDVTLPWHVRAAQLCLARGVAYFVPLRFSFESILLGDPEMPKGRPILEVTGARARRNTLGRVPSP
jgi:hypothetical protein